MKIFVICLFPFLLSAQVHYAKVEPFDKVTLKSAVSGLVLASDIQLEGHEVNGIRIIHIDDRLDYKNLEMASKSKALLQEMLTLNQDIAETLLNTLQRQKGYYQRLDRLTTASKTQKDNAYNAYSTAKTQYLSTKEKIVSLKKQLLDIDYKIVQLQDSIAKKSLELRHQYLYKLMVRKGDFVAPGSVLAQVMDTSRAKLVLFLVPEELNNIDKKHIYLNGKVTKYKVNKIWKVADEKFVSSYRAEIYIDAPKEIFSTLLKVEIK